MKKLLLLVLLAGAGYGGVRGYKYLSERVAREGARHRVEECLRAASIGDNQASLSQWAEGKVALDWDALTSYSPPYDRFCNRIGLRPGSRWSVGNVEVVSSEEVYVSITVDGKSHELLVVPGTPMEVQ